MDICSTVHRSVRWKLILDLRFSRIKICLDSTCDINIYSLICHEMKPGAMDYLYRIFLLFNVYRLCSFIYFTCFESGCALSYTIAPYSFLNKLKNMGECSSELECVYRHAPLYSKIVIKNINQVFNPYHFSQN